MKTEKITVQATISADSKKVWDCYTKPEHITKWNFATEDWQCPSASNDLRVGGQYKARMEAKDGSYGFDFEAVYTEVMKYEQISYSLGTEVCEGRQATVSFTKDGNQTVVAVTFDAESQNPVEMQRDGWQAILNNFKKYTEHQ